MLDLLKLLKLDNIFNSLVGYIETKIEYYKIQFKEEIARALAILIFIFLLSLMMVLFLIFFSFYIVAILNHLLSSQFLGFVIVAGFYLILAMLIYTFREELIYEMVYRVFFNKPENEKEPDEQKEKINGTGNEDQM